MPYPESDWQQPNDLTSKLGSFWDQFFTGRHQLETLLQARAIGQTQVLQAMEELVSSMDCRTVPLQRQRVIQPIYFNRDDLTSSQIARFGEGKQYGSELLFGRASGTGLPRYPLPSKNLTSVPMLLNRLSGASLTWVEGIDYVVDNDAIVFMVDPLETGLVAEDQGTFILWAVGCGEEHHDLYTNFGFVFGPKFPSTEAYRRWVLACIRALNEGSPKKWILELICAALDVPKARGVETVLFITETTHSKYIVTDVEVYTCPKVAQVLVSPGQVLEPGQLLTDALELISFAPGSTYASLAGLALGDSLLTVPGWTGFELVFENQDKPVVVSYDKDGFTKFEFELKGHPGDVRAFWDAVHADGRARGQTLAMVLDSRPVKEGQPTFVALPTKVNPLKFLFDNFFRVGFTVAKINLSKIGAQAPGVGFLRTINNFLHPNTCILFAFEISGRDTDSLPQGPAERGSSAVIRRGSDTTIGTSYAAERGQVRIIRGRCL